MVDPNTMSSSALYEKLASLCEQYPIEDVIEQLHKVTILTKLHKRLLVLLQAPHHDYATVLAMRHNGCLV
jgi:hypothetical protein